MLRDQLFGLSILGCSIFLSACSQGLDRNKVPDTRAFKGHTIDTYHDVLVSDPYRALENWDNPSVQAWSDKQTERAIQCAMSLEQYDDIKAEILKKARAEEIADTFSFALAFTQDSNIPSVCQQR